MKKINVCILIGLAALFLLSPEFLNAQKRVKKTGTLSGGTRPKAKPASKTTTATKRQSVEPTEAEMKEALLKGMEERGGTRKPDDSIEINNAVAGWIVKIESFEKLGCRAAASGVGYFCDYRATTSTAVRSNEGTTAGDRHAAAWNILLGGMGARYTTATATKRFVQSKTGWTALDE